jgi:hypothetical protein
MYATITHPEVAFHVSNISQFIQEPCSTHLKALVYWSISLACVITNSSSGEQTSCLPDIRKRTALLISTVARYPITPFISGTILSIRVPRNSHWPHFRPQDQSTSRSLTLPKICSGFGNFSPNFPCKPTTLFYDNQSEVACASFACLLR